MENNMHIAALEILIDKIQDDLEDAYKSYHAAMKMSLYKNNDIVDFCIDDCKSRLKHSDVVRDKIAYIIRQTDLQENPFRNSYLKTLESIEDLKIKVSKFEF